MGPATTVGLAWLLFGGTHVGLSTRPVRTRLVARLGEAGFTALYFFVATVTFTILVGTYGALRDAGAGGFAAGPTLRAALAAVVVAGIVLVVAGVVPYPRSAYALFRTTSPVEPRGMERLTRHPFFAGTALVGVAHALLAHRLTGVVFFGGLALFALAGAWHQDRKLLAVRGDQHAAFMKRTSLVPFAAIVTGRQRLVVRELPLGAIALGAATAWLLGGPAHAAIMAHGGAYVVLAVVGGGTLAALQAWQREGLRGRGTAERLLGPALVLLGFAHAAVTLVVFPDVLSELGARGVIGAISVDAPGGLIGAFCFAILAPVLVLLGWVTSHALATGDRVLFTVLAWFIAGTGALGALLVPVSGFWALLAIGVVMLRASGRRGLAT
jgi:uncharacterized membrane protein